jgi:rubrerythrin
MTIPPNTPQPRYEDEDKNDPSGDQQNRSDDPYEAARAVKRSLEDALGSSAGNLLGQALGGGLRSAFGSQLGGMLDNTMRSMINEATGGQSGGSPRAEDGDEVYEMLWDCRFCGTTKLLGKTHRFCPNCGSPQDPEWRYYPADDEKIAVKEHHYVGADKVCPACGTLNAADAQFCPRCSAPQTEAAAVSQLQTRIEGIDGRLDREDLQARLDAQAAAAVSGQTMVVSKPAFRLKPQHIALIVVVLALIGGGIYFLTASRSTNVVLADKQWSREIDIEQLVAVSDSAVCSSMPGDAYNVSRRREQIDTRRVQDGETCTRQQVDQGDGTFREQQVCSPKYREEPVYGDMCYYSIDRWQVERTVSSNGAASAASIQPFWAEANISRSGSCRGCEREGNRREVYMLVLQGDGGSQYECEVDASLWDDAKIESVWSLDVGSFTNAARCDSLKLAS